MVSFRSVWDDMCSEVVMKESEMDIRGGVKVADGRCLRSNCPPRSIQSQRMRAENDLELVDTVEL